MNTLTPFSNATGRGIRVAVIDSGVNPDHPHIGGVAGGISIGVNADLDTPDFQDRLGHGTAVMAAIQEKAPAAEYFAVKIFDTELKTTAATLVRAIAWCIDNGMHVVNLSLGSTNSRHADLFATSAAEAAREGQVLASALRVGDERCYPGYLQGVFGVGLDWDCPRDRYRVADEEGGAVFYASGYPRPALGVPWRRNLHGISFAVANMTGFIVRAYEVTPRQGGQRFAVIKKALVEAVA